MELIDFSEKNEAVFCISDNALYIKDILESIFRFLTVRDLIQVRNTCKYWNQISQSSESKFQQQVTSIDTIFRFQ